MSLLIAKLFVWIFYSYLLVGLFFAVWFVALGAERMDDGMKKIPWSTKWVFIPGSVLLWVVLYNKLRKVKSEK